MRVRLLTVLLLLDLGASRALGAPGAAPAPAPPREPAARQDPGPRPEPAPAARPDPGPRPEPAPAARPDPGPRPEPAPAARQDPGPRPEPAARRVLAPHPGSARVRERLAFLVQRLDDARPRLRRWWIAWMATYGGLTAAQGAAVALAPALFSRRSTIRSTRWSMGIGAITSAVGLLFVGLSYPAGFTGSRPATALRDSTEAGERRALARAEALLGETARTERFGRSWLSHVGGALVNLAAGLVLWLALDLPLEGGLQLGLGMVISEAQIWTQPMDAVRDWDAYRAAFPGAVADLPAPALPAWSFTPFPGGLGLTVHY